MDSPSVFVISIWALWSSASCQTWLSVVIGIMPVLDAWLVCTVRIKEIQPGTFLDQAFEVSALLLAEELLAIVCIPLKWQQDHCWTWNAPDTVIVIPDQYALCILSNRVRPQFFNCLDVGSPNCPMQRLLRDSLKHQTLRCFPADDGQGQKDLHSWPTLCLFQFQGYTDKIMKCSRFKVRLFPMQNSCSVSVKKHWQVWSFLFFKHKS